MLGGGDQDVGSVDGVLAQLRRGEQRQLVERQQPARAGGCDEGEPQVRLGPTRAIACSTTPALIGPRKVTAPGTASREWAPTATTRIPYGT